MSLFFHSSFEGNSLSTLAFHGFSVAAPLIIMRRHCVSRQQIVRAQATGTIEVVEPPIHVVVVVVLVLTFHLRSTSENTPTLASTRVSSMHNNLLFILLFDH